MKLVITIPFGPYQKGDVITDAATIKTVLAEHPEKVVKVTIPTAQKG